MANAFFSGASGGTWDTLVETAFNREADFALRDDPVWMQVVDTKANRLAMPGDTITFTIHKDLSATLATTPLTETVDPDAIAPQVPTRVSVALNEYGRATLQTEFLQTLAFTQEERERAVIVGRDMIDTIDSLIKSVADGSTNVAGRQSANLVGNGSVPGSVTATDTFNRNVAAGVVSLMRADKVVPKDGDNYLAIAHPHVLYDIMAENSATAWIGPHAYGTDTANFYNGEVGTLLGARYLRTNRVTTATDGAASAKVYRSYFVGQQAIAEGVGYDPHIVVGPVVDKLKRFNPLGWKFLGGYGLYRPQSIRKVYTASSLGTLT